jgi:hypothetical protein
MIRALARVGLWFFSLLLSVTVFTLLFSLVLGAPGALPLIFRMTMIFAFPVWCVYIPYVVFANVRSRRFVLAASFGAPGLLALWFFFLQLKGTDPESIWRGDPLVGFGGIWGLLFAFVVGFLASFFYVMGSRVLRFGCVS